MYLVRVGCTTDGVLFIDDDVRDSSDELILDDGSAVGLCWMYLYFIEDIEEAVCERGVS